MKKDTRIHLVEELKKLEPRPAILEMIKEAEAGEYHDYKNKKYNCGKVESYNRLTNLGHFALAKRIRDGEFDEAPDAEDLAMLRKDALAGGFNEQQVKVLFGL